MANTKLVSSAVLKLIVATPIIISSSHLQLLGPNQKHSLYPQLKLLAYHLLKDTSRHVNFLSQKRRSYWHQGEKQLKVDMLLFSRDGKRFLSKEDWSISTICNWRYRIPHRNIQFRYWLYISMQGTSNNTIITAPGFLIDQNIH